MTKQQIIDARRWLLSEEIRRRGLSVVAKAAGKPDRQIKDMAAGRKSFGDGVSIEIGPKIRPDLPRDWLVYPSDEVGSFTEAPEISKRTESTETNAVTYAQIKAAVSGVLNAFGLDYTDLVPNEKLPESEITAKLLLLSNTNKPVDMKESPGSLPERLPGEKGDSNDRITKKNPRKRAEGGQ